jgi:hypothetical protein
MSVTDAGLPTQLPGTVQAAPDGLLGFDANTPISAAAARTFHDRGYRFAVRYVGRREMKPHDLSTAEAKTILAAGLALMPVQHVEMPGWHPTAVLGNEYGSNAAKFARQLGFPPGVCVWCDLEEVSGQSTAADVIGYCNAWYDAVKAAGYVPGVYVGYNPGLTGEQLYARLRFSHYWGAYNVDVTIPSRGWQLKQSVGHGAIAGITTEDYDDDRTITDRKGGQAFWLVQ